MNIERTIKNLKDRGFDVTHFSGGKEALEYLCGAINGVTVGIGGCKTADQLGIYDRLCENNTVYWHWKDSSPDVRQNENTAEVFICSANAVSENGELLNIDGAGNRIAGQVFGHKKVYIIIGTNKICPDFDSALYRARNVAAVQNCARFGKKTPCQVDGKCHDCRSKERICNALTVQWAPMMGMETEVVIIDEELGM